MKFNCLTVFPEIIESYFQSSIAARALNTGIIECRAINIRDYSTDKHKRTDDYPFGGGAGMVMTPQPVFDCFEALLRGQTGSRINIYMSPAGDTFNTQTARMLSLCDHLNILCGHYEGVDQRVLDTFIDLELSVGDYVLTGGELPALTVMDAVMRFIPGVLGNETSAENESFSAGLLEYPQYTRPAEFRGLKVPDVLLSGHHENISKWQREQALTKTFRVRPDLLTSAGLTKEDEKLLAGLTGKKTLVK